MCYHCTYGPIRYGNIPISSLSGYKILSVFCSDDPSTIKLRFISVAISCSISILITIHLLPWSSYDQLLSAVGISWPQSIIWSLVTPLLITSLLFLGPLVLFKDTYNWPEFVNYVKTEATDLQFVRNYMVAPLSEEFIFRGVLIAILEQSFPLWSSIIISGILFSLAHSHHYFFQSIQGSDQIRLTDNLFQMSYTFVFAVYSATLYLKTRTILTTIQVHIFCNFLGFPQLDVLLSDDWYKRASLIGLGSFLIFYPIYLMT